MTAPMTVAANKGDTTALSAAAMSAGSIWDVHAPS